MTTIMYVPPLPIQIRKIPVYENKHLDTTYASFYKIPMSMTTSTASPFTAMSTPNSAPGSAAKSRSHLDNRQLISTVDDRGLGFDFDQDGQADLLRIRNINGNVTTRALCQSKDQKQDHLTYVLGLHGQLHTQTSNFALEAGHQLQHEWHICLQPGLWPAASSNPCPFSFLLIPDDQQNFVASNQNLDFTRAHHFVLGYEYKPNRTEN